MTSTRRLRAIEVDVERARGVMTAKTKEQEGSAVEFVKRKLAVDKAGLSLPGVRWVTWTIPAVINWCLDCNIT